MKKVRECLDCGNAPVAYHFIEKTSIFINWLLSPINNFLDLIWRKIEKILGSALYEKIGPKLIRGLLFLKLGKKYYDPDENTGGRARVFWEEAKRRDISIFEFRLLNRGREVFLVSWKGKERAFDGLPRPGIGSSKSLMWMDNKGTMRKEFIKANIPVANGGVFFFWQSLKNEFNKLKKPVIIKPNLGSRSRHTTTHIETKEELKKAFKNANMLSPWVILEEEHQGFVHRATVIDKKLVGVLRREPPFVVGDGIRNIKELIEKENERPERRGPIFHKIYVTDETYAELQKQNIKLDEIPDKNKIITLAQKASRGLGGGATNVTHLVHIDNIKLFEYVGEVLDDPLVGIDFIISDISKSWKETPRCGVIECNSLPFIDLHHFPLDGEPINVAGKLWDAIYPDSKK
jgi:cyanophycin synthetase